jgi:hypothetical protein
MRVPRKGISMPDPNFTVTMLPTGRPDSPETLMHGGFPKNMVMVDILEDRTELKGGKAMGCRNL